jgi:hypothetical protein
LILIAIRITEAGDIPEIWFPLPILLTVAIGDRRGRIPSSANSVCDDITDIHRRLSRYGKTVGSSG